MKADLPAGALSSGKRALLAIIVMAALGILAPATELSAQSLPANLRALDEALPGDLVNDPSRIDWESYGRDFSSEVIVDESIPGGGAARRFHVNAPTEFIYTAGTSIPLIRKIKRGDQITISFYARTISARNDSGKGILRMRFQQNAEPFPGFGEEALEIGTSWNWYEVTAGPASTN